MRMETKACCTELLACLSCLYEDHKLFDRGMKTRLSDMINETIGTNT